jgi:hypothetical protein
LYLGQRWNLAYRQPVKWCDHHSTSRQIAAMRPLRTPGTPEEPTAAADGCCSTTERISLGWVQEVGTMSQVSGAEGKTCRVNILSFRKFVVVFCTKPKTCQPQELHTSDPVVNISSVTHGVNRVTRIWLHFRHSAINLGIRPISATRIPRLPRFFSVLVLAELQNHSNVRTLEADQNKTVFLVSMNI